MKPFDTLITGGEPEVDEEMNEIDFMRSQGLDPADIEKRFSRSFGNKQKRQNQLVARLKRKRNYKNPVKGGTGKQARSKRSIFTKHLDGEHDQKKHGNRPGPPYGSVSDREHTGRSRTGKAGEKLYHVSRPSSRDSIRTEGLRLSDIDGQHLWTVENLEAANRIRPGFDQDGKTDIWEIDVEGMSLAGEFHLGLPGSDREDTAILHEAVPPEKVKLMEFVEKHLPGEHDQSKHGNKGVAYFHASDVEFEAGDIVSPAGEIGHKSKWSDVDEYRSDQVYVFDQNVPEFASEGWGKHIYEVTPTGRVRADPERDSERWEHPEDDPARSSFIVEGAVVLRRLDKNETITKHLPGQHDQKTHGNRKGKRGDWAKSGNERHEGNRVNGPSASLYGGQCYERSALQFLNMDTSGIGTDSTLVHGILQHPTGDVAHGWVILPDGYVLEPASDRVYHPEDFDRIFDPITIVEYGDREVLGKMEEDRNFGPWDSLSGLWYEHYYEIGGGHAMNSHGATSKIVGLMEMLEEG